MTGEGRHPDRTTPARAESTLLRSVMLVWRRDHPCGGGEHSPPFGDVGVASGSPLRGRGARSTRVFSARVVGSTPARAGSTPATATTARVSRDHPRAGGEHWRPWDARSRDHGITPARAGSTKACAQVTENDRDHPRAGGEHGRTMMDTEDHAGSPPRGRGAPLLTCILRLTGALPHALVMGVRGPSRAPLTHHGGESFQPTTARHQVPECRSRPRPREPVVPSP